MKRGIITAVDRKWVYGDRTFDYLPILRDYLSEGWTLDESAIKLLQTGSNPECEDILKQFFPSLDWTPISI